MSAQHILIRMRVNNQVLSQHHMQFYHHVCPVKEAPSSRMKEKIWRMDWSRCNTNIPTEAHTLPPWLSPAKARRVSMSMWAAAELAWCRLCSNYYHWEKKTLNVCYQYGLSFPDPQSSSDSLKSNIWASPPPPASPHLWALPLHLPSCLFLSSYLGFIDIKVVAHFHLNTPSNSPTFLHSSPPPTSPCCCNWWGLPALAAPPTRLMLVQSACALSL